MSPFPLQPQPQDLQPTIGSWSLGSIASVGLTGISTLQVWIYFQKYPQDTPVLKCMVAVIWILEILRSSVAVHAGYYFTILHWGDLEFLKQPVWSMKLMIMLTNVLELIVHCFFIHKVLRITKKRGRGLWISLLITIFALGDFVLGTASFVAAWMRSDYALILYGLPQHLAIGALSSSIGADWLICLTLVLFFRENRSDIPRTDRLIKRLIFYSINLGLLTSFLDLVVLILATITWSTPNFYQLSVFLVVGNVYANTALACLNARNMISNNIPQPPTSNHSIKTLQNLPIPIPLHLLQTQSTPIPTSHLELHGKGSDWKDTVTIS